MLDSRFVVINLFFRKTMRFRQGHQSIFDDENIGEIVLLHRVQRLRRLYLKSQWLNVEKGQIKRILKKKNYFFSVKTNNGLFFFEIPPLSQAITFAGSQRTVSKPTSTVQGILLLQYGFDIRGIPLDRK